ncbi:hypothetical protein IWZ01DRAFT_118329 [Phyllosticta capitalensis]
MNDLNCVLWVSGVFLLFALPITLLLLRLPVAAHHVVRACEIYSGSGICHHHITYLEKIPPSPAFVWVSSVAWITDWIHVFFDSTRTNSKISRSFSLRAPFMRFRRFQILSFLHNLTYNGRYWNIKAKLSTRPLSPFWLLTPAVLWRPTRRVFDRPSLFAFGPCHWSWRCKLSLWRAEMGGGS